MTEEATEVLLAAKDDAVAERTGADRSATRAALAGEAADLLYHALVLLAERAVSPAEVIAALRARHGALRPIARQRCRPISRRRLPIRTSSHSPAIGSGTCSRVGHPRRR